MALATLPGCFRSVTASATQTLVIFDRHLEDLELLYNALAPNAIAYSLDNTTDAIPAITQLLSDTGATSLAIVAHGEAGKIKLGAGSINLDALNLHAGLLQEWGISEIALYSCQVGANAGFISRLEELTGAKIAAATGKVGAATLGGSWELDVRNGEFTADVFVAEQAVKYAGVLAQVNATNGIDNFDGSGDGTTNNTTNGNDIITITDLAQVEQGDVFNGGGGNNDTIALNVAVPEGNFIGINRTNIDNIEKITGNNLNQQLVVSAAQLQGLNSIDLGAGVEDFLAIYITAESYDFSLVRNKISNVEKIELVSFENTATIIGSGYDESIFGIGSSSNTIDGGGGNDNIAGYGATATLTGGDGNDFIYGYATTNTMTGGDGNDAILGYGATHTIDGGVGNDAILIVANGATNTMTGGAGDDTMTGSADGKDTVVYSGKFTDYAIKLTKVKATNGRVTDASAIITDNRQGTNDGIDNVSNVDTFRFSDGDYIVDPQDPTKLIPNVTADTTPPEAASGLSLKSDTGANTSDGITKDGTFNVTIPTLGNGESWEYSTNNGGSWTLGSGYGDRSFTVGEGNYATDAIQVRTKDTAGNTSTAIKFDAKVTIDTTAPDAASGLSLAAGTSTITKDGKFNVTIPTLSSDESWEYTTDNGGSWTLGSGYGDRSFTVGNANYAANAIQVRTIDTAGNTSNAIKYYSTLAVSTNALEAAGTTLLKINELGEYVANNGGVDLNLIYKGSKFGPTTYADWRVRGAEIVGTEVRAVWQNLQTGAFLYTTNAGEARTLTGKEFLEKEAQFQQDFDGNNAIDFTPLVAENFGTTTLKVNDAGEYVANNGGADLNLIYKGSTVGPKTYVGWEVIAAKIVANNDIKAVWKNTQTGKFFASTNSGEERAIAGNDLFAQEVEFQRDFSGDGAINYGVTTGKDIYVIDGSVARSLPSSIKEATNGGTDTLAITGATAVNIDLWQTTAQTVNANLVLTVVNVENIIATSGDDRLAGSSRNNTFTGGAGKDTFVFGGAGVTTVAQLGVDTITDFNVVDDAIELSKTVFGNLTANGNVLNLSQFSTVIGATVGTSGITYNSTNGKLFYDSTLFAQLSTGLELTNDDFFVVGSKK